MAEGPIALLPPLGPLILQVGRGLQFGRLVISGAAAGGLTLDLQTQPLTEAEIRRQMTNILPKFATTLSDPDNLRVLRLSDAIKCVEETLYNPATLGAGLAQSVASVVAALVTEGRGPIATITAPELWTKSIVKCMRGKVLSQGNPRQRVTKEIYQRI